MKAGRLLLNDPPPPEKTARRSFSESHMLEIAIHSGNSGYAVEGCIFRELYPKLKDDPTQFLEQSRLAAIFALKASQIFEHIVDLRLGPLSNGQLEVFCRGQRRQVY